MFAESNQIDKSSKVCRAASNINTYGNYLNILITGKFFNDFNLDSTGFWIIVLCNIYGFSLEMKANEIRNVNAGIDQKHFYFPKIVAF